MEIIRSLESLNPLQGSVLTLGSYDGIHRGHREILSSVVNHARARSLKSVLITFDPHPRHVLEKDKRILPLLMSMEEKLEIIKDIGLEYLYIIKFTNEFSNTSAGEFLDNTIIPFFNPKYIIVGYDHHFGKNREGGPEFLTKYCLDNSINLEIIEPVSDDDNHISSSRIRNLIKNGYIRRANFELGSVYGFNAIVVKGAGRGKELSFPTANVIPICENQLMPKSGVYFIRGRFIGHHAFGMCNFGVRPTFGESELVMEIHFFHDSTHDLYGKEIRVEFLERIRDEEKFPSPKKLSNQLKRDKQKCLELKGKYE
tara:strand:- start:1503 stop:2441 length:939 start_codon:yes stop_codon:yes gene_type:complete